MLFSNRAGSDGIMERNCLLIPGSLRADETVPADWFLTCSFSRHSRMTFTVLLVLSGSNERWDAVYRQTPFSVELKLVLKQLSLDRKQRNGHLLTLSGRVTYI